MKKLEGKIALITGSSKGIGKATAIALAKEGCTVVINYKTDEKSARAVLDECNSYSEGNILIKADVSVESDVVNLSKQIKDQLGHIEVLVNNVGIFYEDDGYTNIQVFEDIYKNNFLSCVLVTKYILPLMKQGKIINISSLHGKLGYGRPTAIAYSAFKSALESYTKNLAKELAPDVLVNAVAPGRVVTSMWGDLDTDQQEELGKVHLIKRMIRPEEVADAILFLVKNDAVCGEILTIDGGMSLASLI